MGTSGFPSGITRDNIISGYNLYFFNITKTGIMYIAHVSVFSRLTGIPDYFFDGLPVNPDFLNCLSVYRYIMSRITNNFSKNKCVRGLVLCCCEICFMAVIGGNPWFLYHLSSSLSELINQAVAVPTVSEYIIPLIPV